MRTALPNFFRKTLYISFLFLFATTTTSALEVAANNKEATDILPTSILEAIGKSFKLNDGSVTDTDPYLKTIENNIISSSTLDKNGLEVVARLRTNYDVGNVDCYGGNNGYATVYVTGGTGPYTYQWSHGPTTHTIESLVAGTYRLEVEDADGNRTNCRVKIKEPSRLNNAITKLSDASAYGSSDGSARVRVNGGTRPYTYAWDNGETTDIATALNAGQHTVTITDANGCTTECSVVIDEPEPEPEDCVNDADCDGVPVDEDCDDTDPNNTNTIPDAPTNLACYQEATYNPATCSWDITGTQEPEPAMVNCWDVFIFDDATCTWENQGVEPEEPQTECGYTATFNSGTCAWEVTGGEPEEPTKVNCWDDFVFDDATCTWENQGTQDPNDADCDGVPVDEDCDDTDPNNTNTIPDAPTNLACYQEATYNPATCSWDITGTQEPEPAMVNCWDVFVFDDATCTWENQGVEPEEPQTECGYTATFNSGTCAWEVTGGEPEEPTKVNCWDDFVLNDATCTWENQGTQDPNDADCDGVPVDEDCDDTDPNNTNTIPDAPTNLACYQEATYNPATCSWDITGTQEPEPAMVNCWDVFVFDDATCTWENQGVEPEEPQTECGYTATFNSGTCAWEVTGGEPEEPTKVNCWDVFVFDDATCTWENQGTQTPEPTKVNCWDVFVFDDATCTWENQGVEPEEPQTECGYTATFNSGTCAWEVTGGEPEEPTKVNCWDVFVFDDATCTWENQGTQAPEPTNLECWETTTFNTNTCSWDITGTQEPEPTDLECGKAAEFNANTCEWDIIDTEEDCTEPPIGCETAFARYEEGGVEDEIDEPNDGRCFEDDGFQRWGWTNQFSAPGSYDLQLYSGAGQCGFLNRQSGNVTVVWENNMVTVSINLLPGFEMQQAHLYVGGNDYPTIQRGPNTVETVAPGQYPYQDGDGVNPEITTPVTSYTFNPVDVTGLSEIFVIVHAVTCEVEICKSAGENGFLTICEGDSPNPTEEELFAELTGADEGGTWSINDAIYTYTIAATDTCPEVSSTVTVTYEDCNSCDFGTQLGQDIDGEAAGDQSGRSVSMSADGSRVAIGGVYNDDNGTDSGHVRLYEYNGSGWVQLGADIDGEALADYFGTSVSLSSDGSRVAIGSSGNDGNGINSGHVRLYEYNGTDWVQLGADIDGEASVDQSGSSVSLSADGSRVAIGSSGNDGNGNDSGHVRVFDWNGSAWVQTGADIDGEAANDRLGFSVSLSSDGSRLAIGIIFSDDGPGNDSGQVRIYEYDSGSNSWSQLGGNIDGEGDNDQSGHSVSLSSDGSRVAIGAPLNDGTGTDTGQVRIFEYDSGSATWSQLGADIDGQDDGDWAGYSVSLSADGSRVALDARYNDDGLGNNSGQVRIFEYDSGSNSWSQQGGDILGEAADDLSGWSVSLSGDGSRVAIGAIFNDGNGISSGHVRVYGCAQVAEEEEESLVLRQSSLSSMTVFQKPQSKVLSVDLDISYDAEVNTSFQDLSGRTVLTAPTSQVSAGANHLEYDLGTLPTEVLIMKVYTGREIISKKVLIINK